MDDSSREGRIKARQRPAIRILPPEDGTDAQEDGAAAPVTSGNLRTASTDAPVKAADDLICAGLAYAFGRNARTEGADAPGTEGNVQATHVPADMKKGAQAVCGYQYRPPKMRARDKLREIIKILKK